MLKLQDRFLAFLAAICTYFMRRFAVFHAFLKNVGESTAPVIVQYISLFLAFPVFKLHNLFFQIAYLANERRLLLLSRKSELLGGRNFPVEFNRKFRDFGNVAKLNQRLREIASGLERTKRHADSINHKNHSSFG